MRLAGLLVLAIFFPALARAAPPSLTTYTVSRDTIYPGAAADSGSATTTSIDIAFSEQVKASIKIISASGAMIKSLYSSSSVTNPTPKVWDGTNTAGVRVDNGAYTILISATSTATSLSIIDASKTVTVASSNSSVSSDSSVTASGMPSDTTSVAETAAVPHSTGGPAEYLPIPMLRIVTGGARTVSSGADIAFSAVVYDGKSNIRNDAVVTWSFGDGMRKTGASVFHEYYDPGEYIAVAHATTPDGGNARGEIIITVKNASIRIASVSSRGIILANNDSRTLDLSLWRLSMDGQEFKIPEDTQILAGHTILFPSQVIELPIADVAFLLYPSGEVAAAYPAVTAVTQPPAATTSYSPVKAVEPITSPQKNIQAHEQAVIAPTAAVEPAAVGAALPPPTLSVGVSTSEVGTVSVAKGIFKSPWTFGLLGVMALAGGAFIFL